MNRTAAAAVKKATAQQEVQEAVVLVAAEVDLRMTLASVFSIKLSADESTESTPSPPPIHRRAGLSLRAFERCVQIAA